MNAPQVNVINLPRVAEHEVLSKVIAVEGDSGNLSALKSLFEEYRLIGYRVNMENAFSVIGANIDLGGVFVADEGSGGQKCGELIRAIHDVRPDLPVFLCLQPGRQADDLPEEVTKALAGIFTAGDHGRARELIDTYLFSRHYPSEFVSEIKEMTVAALRSSFKDMQIEVEHPYIVKDKVIYGEMFSLIPLESNWCRGYMTLQAEEHNIVEIIRAKKSSVNTPEATFVHVNAVLGELSNMVWGSFKNRYGVKNQQDGIGQVRVEIPIIVNHLRKYISFGSDDPQLCFKFTVSDPEGRLAPSTIYQKFVFSLDWAPEKYAESNQQVNELVSSGELELF